MTTYKPTTPEPHGTRYDAPEAFTVKQAKAILLGLQSLGWLVLACWLGLAQALTVPAIVALVLAVFVGINAWLLSMYTGRLVARELPREQHKAQRVGDTYRIHLHRELPVGDRGSVDMEPDRVDLPVPPSEFVRIVRAMRETGTSRDKRPAGVSQPLHAKILRALEDMDAAENGGPGVGWKLTDDINALLDDIAQW